MAFVTPKLEFAHAALEPHISANTVKFHYGKHTKKYFDTVNELVKGTTFERAGTLEELLSRTNMLKMDTALFNNACQAWNHASFWKCLAPSTSAGDPSSELVEAINRDFGSFQKFKQEFSDVATKFFGSGWVWLMHRDGKLLIKATPNAENPIKDAQATVLLVLDVWEHSYYLDYQNDRKAYVENWWEVVNWTHVNSTYATCMGDTND